MRVQDFLKLYRADSFIQNFFKTISVNPSGSARFQLKGTVSSLDAVIGAVTYQQQPRTCLFVLHDKEEAAYFYNDLQNLTEQEVHFFPMSYKKPYQFEDTDNANVLRRAEVISRLHGHADGELVVTYPEALTEKVISKKSLVQHSFPVRVKDRLDGNFLSEFLISYDFDKTDFVYEAGQFSIRGGIIDVFSYANELPYRIELFGDEVESIRTFNPDTQLSVDPVEAIKIVPNLDRVLQQNWISFLDYFPAGTLVWIKDVELTVSIIDKYFDKAEQHFRNVLQGTLNTRVISDPAEVFETGRRFTDVLKKFTVIEFGSRFYYPDAQRTEYPSSPQPSFNKDFQLLTESLQDNLTHGITNIIVADSLKQLERLRTIFDETDPYLKYQTLNIALRGGFTDHQLKIACYTDHQIFDRFHRYKTRERFSKNKALTLKELKTLQPGDYVVHEDYGVGRFAGLEKVEVNGHEQETIRLVYRDDDLLYISIYALHKISKYSSKESVPPTMSKLGSPEWENKKSRVKKQVKDIARELINLYAKRRVAPGYAYTRDSFLQVELESSFLYEDTPDQAKATAAVKEDMEQQHPMDRLICGDVGFGKTEIAIRAAFKAVADNKQVAVLVPTTVLAIQHYKTFRDRLEKLPAKIEYINRFKSTQQIKETLQRIKSGETNILIGTHRIVNNDVQFKDLGLLIIDEEQKFGVKTKDKLKEMRVNVDVLTLTATPIPRTLQFSLLGARDLSIIATPPPNRQAVTTELHVYNEVVIRNAVSYELRRGGQVFFVHNRVGDIEAMGSMILRLVPDARIAVAHGQMEGEKLEKTMLKFIDGEYDVLVSTNIIESGLDIPNANTMLINHAHQFGLSDLHQMRGRVGRSNRKAYCYLLVPAVSALTPEARKRLTALEEFSDLGEGFKIAMRDLDIRGAGNLLGAEQSGFISDLGFEMYHQVLDNAIKELKEEEFKDLFIKELPLEKELRIDCMIETDLQIIIPEGYVSNISERLNLYAQLDNIKNEEVLTRFSQSLVDRFGPMPPEVQDLIQIVRMRWLAGKLGMEKLTIKNDTMKGYFVSTQNESFYKSATFDSILKYLQKNPRKARLKENKNRPMIVFDEIKSISQAIETLSSV